MHKVNRRNLLAQAATLATVSGPPRPESQQTYTPHPPDHPCRTVPAETSDAVKPHSLWRSASFKSHSRLRRKINHDLTINHAPIRGSDQRHQCYPVFKSNRRPGNRDSLRFVL